jgi:hypothetical protein
MPLRRYVPWTSSGVTSDPATRFPHGPGDPPSSMLVGRLPAVPFQAVLRRAGWR